MAKYEINHTCGHTSTVQLFGKCSERERKIEWMERQECPECRRKREAEEAAKITEGLELPELEGSEKQVAWANCIRARFAEEISSNEKYQNGNPMKVLKSVTSAKTFIDNRDSTLYGFLTGILRQNPALMN